MKVSAGLLMCRIAGGELEVLLAHPGGPFYARKDEGVWSVPKGLVGEGEEPLDAARREFQEETGLTVHADRFYPLGEVRQRGKRVCAWAFVGDCDPESIQSNEFELQWPPRSGRIQRFPEIDRAAFFDPDTARRKILPAQQPLVDRAHELFQSGVLRPA